jgi:hypothetical protein
MSGVAGAKGVAVERIDTTSGVAAAVVEPQCGVAYGSVEDASGVAQERSLTDRGIKASARVACQRKQTEG